MERDLASLKEGVAEENLLHSSLQSLQPFHQQWNIARREHASIASAHCAELLDSLACSHSGRSTCFNLVNLNNEISAHVLEECLPLSLLFFLFSVTLSLYLGSRK